MLGLPSIDANISTRVSLGKGQASVTPEASLKISGSDFSCGDMTGAREYTSFVHISKGCRGLSHSFLPLDPPPKSVNVPRQGFYYCFHPDKEGGVWTPLEVQSMRIHLPIQGIQVRFLVQKDPTHPGATQPMGHNYRARALEPVSCNC